MIGFAKSFPPLHRAGRGGMNLLEGIADWKVGATGRRFTEGASRLNMLIRRNALVRVGRWFGGWVCVHCCC